MAIPQNNPTSTTPVNILIVSKSYAVSLPSIRYTHLRGLLHHVLGERRIDDEVAVVADNRAGLHLAHSQRESGLAVWHDGRGAQLGEVVQDLGVRKGDDFDRDALLPLPSAPIERTVQPERTVVPRMCEFLR